MLRTRLCEVLKIDVPIIAAPMGFITGPELAAAVSNAGGLGILSGGAAPPHVLRDLIRMVRERTAKPFGVNILLFEVQGIERPVADAVDVCISERVPVISFFWGDPSPYLPGIRAAGLKSMHQVGTVDAARKSARAGVDIIAAQGVEAGGHIEGEISTMALVPRVVDAVAPVPVVAAGGIADGRGVAAALALGAEAVMIGTRFICTPEAEAHTTYQRKVIEAREQDTVRTILFGHGWPNAPHRVLRTAFVEEWLGNEARAQESRPDEPVIAQQRFGPAELPLLRFMAVPPNRGTTGGIESMALYAGQGVGLVNEIKPAAQIVSELVRGAEETLQRLTATGEAAHRKSAR